MVVYKCDNCDNVITPGAKFCSECGSEIKRLNEKKTSAKVLHKRAKIKLPIDPDVLYKVIPRDSSFSKLYQVLLFFFSAGGIILFIVIHFRQKAIQQWLESLRFKECDIDIFKKNVLSIRRCGIWAVVLGIITIVLNLGLIANPEIRLSKYQVTDQAIATNMFISLGYIVCAIIGIVTGSYVCSKTTILLDGLKSDKYYTYSLKDEDEEEEENTDELGDNIDDDDNDEYDDGL